MHTPSLQQKPDFRGSDSLTRGASFHWLHLILLLFMFLYSLVGYYLCENREEFSLLILRQGFEVLGKLPDLPVCWRNQHNSQMSHVEGEILCQILTK